MNGRLVLVERFRPISGESAQLTDIDLVSALLVAVGELQTVQFASVRLERTALSEGLVAVRTPVRTDTCRAQHRTRL